MIRPGRAGDAAAIARILRDYGFGCALAETPEETKARVSDGLLFFIRDEGHTIRVAENPRGRVVGFVCVAWTRNLRFGVDGYVAELFVHSSWRGRGLGGLLLEAVKQEARRRGCGRLLFSNQQGESYARGFYRKHGWQECEDAALFVLHLPQGKQLPALVSKP